MMADNRKYDVRLYHVNTKTGETLVGHDHGAKMNATPMTHKESCTFKSKLTDRKGIEYRLVEANH